ncbi:MAG TPA: carbohydrate kinase [Pedococcus sp.]|nr:carbohydrate kinase [Pedococcus sp.]
MSERLLVVGEALVDIVSDAAGQRVEHVGGSPANVAVGLARLGHSVDFACCLGHDPRGTRISSYLSSNGVALLPQSFGDQPTSTALAVVDSTGAATYEFDLHWDLPALTVDPQTVHVHTGSIGAVLAPGATSVTAVLRAARERGTVSYDPNIRPGIMGDLAAVRERVEELVALSDVVKASEDDLALLYAASSPEEVMAHWVRLGAALVVVTLGAAGVIFRVTADQSLGRAPTKADRVVDTVGAGDSFMAGLVSGLAVDGLVGGPPARDRLRQATLGDVEPAVARGLSTSAVTVGRAGAYAPSLDEL